MDFSLSRTSEYNFPTVVKSADGKEYLVRADVRTVLTIFRLLTDNTVLTQHKPLLIQRLFFISDVPQDGFECFIRFMQSEGHSDAEPQDDFEFDAKEIYADFVQFYHIDLMTEDVHWRKFLILLANLPETSSLKKKIELRFADTSKLKGKDRARMEEEKAKVQLPVRLTREEQKAQEEFIKEWGSIE